MPKMLTVDELAQRLVVHRITIYRLLKSGALPGFKVGRIWRFDLDQIDAWMHDRINHNSPVQQNFPAEATSEGRLTASAGRENKHNGKRGGRAGGA
jgi:excisionase family DNA binding protein